MKVTLQQYRALLVQYIGPHKRPVLLLAVLFCSNLVLMLVNPQIIRSFIDAAQSGASGEALLRSALLFLSLALAQQVSEVMSRYIGARVAWAATNALRNDVAEHCLGLDLSFHNTHTPGEMIERIDGDINTLSTFFSELVIQLVGSALLLVGILALLFREDWRVGLVISAFAASTTFIIGKCRNIAVPHWTAERQASAALISFLEERLAGTEDIRANGAEAYVMHHFYRLIRASLQKSLKAGLMVNVLFNSMLFMFAAGTAVAFITGAYLYQAGIVTIGTVYLIFHYTTMLERPINVIAHELGELQKAGAAIMRLRELLNVQSKVRGAILQMGTQAALANGPLRVAFSHVTFSYDDDLPTNGNGKKTAAMAENGKNGKGDLRQDAQPVAEKAPVLRDISFQLKAGRILGLLGRTGSGKTTLIRLLFRFYDPDRGAVYFSNADQPGRIDLRQLPLENLRQHVGMVTQNIQLFHATVRDNLTFFDSSVSDEKIQQVIETLELGEWFQSLPQGLDTVLEAGGGLSAGEAQLLAFTRIFLKNPGLVIMDEASSRLDPATEMLIERAVNRLMQNRTAIIVAHRLGTVQRADEIMILERGEIVEHGERIVLANDTSSRFYHLLQTGLEEVLV